MEGKIDTPPVPTIIEPPIDLMADTIAVQVITPGLLMTLMDEFARTDKLPPLLESDHTLFTPTYDKDLIGKYGKPGMAGPVLADHIYPDVLQDLEAAKGHMDEDERIKQIHKLTKAKLKYDAQHPPKVARIGEPEKPPHAPET